MSQIQVDNIYNKEATGSPNFPLGANVTGVVTATSFSGSGANLTGIDATALKDSNGTVRVQANTTGAVITGNVSVGGTLTYEDVTNVDAVGLITARDGIRVTGGDVQVGSAVTVDTSGINVTGVVTATSYRGDGSQLSGIEAAPTAQLVTSENLVAGDSVSVKTNGQVEKVTSNVTQITPPDGTAIWVNGSQDGDEASVASDPLNPTKLFAIYRHQNNQIYSRIGTVTGIASYEDISWLQRGTNLSPITSNTNDAVSVCNIGSGKYLIVVGSNTVYARVVNVNYAANTVTPESGYATLNGGNDCRNWDVESYGTDKAVISYRSNHDSKVYVVGVSISGNTVTLGTPVEFDASTTLGDVNIRRLGNTSKFLTTWLKDSTDGLLCRMGNLDTSTNVVTQVGNELAIDTGQSFTVSALTYTKDNKWICVWKAVSAYHKGAVISYDGTSTITKGTTLQISGAMTDHCCLSYDSDGNRTLDLFENRDTGSGALWATALSISGTTLSATALDEVSGENDCKICRRALVYSSYWGATFGLSEMGSSNDLYKILVKSSTVTTNSDNFIGYVGGSFSATSTATIQVVGNINANQSGLTPGSKYYIQKDGSLDTKESNPSVYAGRALSATSLLIKG